MSGRPRTVLVVHPGGEMFGSDRMMLETVTGLTGAGHPVEVLLPEGGPLVAELEAVGARVTVAPVLVLRKSLLKPRGWPRLLSLAVRGGVAGWRLLRRHRPDAVYVSTITLPQWPLLARLAGARAITHVHEAESSAPRVVRTGLYLPHLAATGVAVNSEVARRTLASALPRLARRAEVIHNGVASPDEPPPPRPEIEAELRVLYVGRLSPRKGPDLVIEAAARLQEEGIPVRVRILGAVFPGYEWFERELRAQAEASGVPVDLLGFDPDVWPALAAADVLVVPSRGDESFGNTALEGVLARRPVVLSDRPGLLEAASGYATTRVVPADDAAAIAAALAEVRTRWSELGAELDRSREEARDRHAPARYRSRIVAAVTGEPLRPVTADDGDAVNVYYVPIARNDRGAAETPERES
ncbi:glycosyltransferase [Brachybacterium squillarum]|uniref:glycosyltransferase n=1 Tax=Brachybacterium squillarum TaxID=661979 RepID=UPI0002629624|nr:glycosyltransferase [Brachybacterium squillarum]